MSEVCISDLSLEIDGHSILNDINITVTPGELVVLLGGNGAGKSSLMKCALGLLSPNQGRVTVDGADVHALGSVDKARRLSYLPQKRPMAWPIQVRDIVALE